MSKSLIKLIDASLIPAAVMICGKVAGLWFVNTVFNLNWGIQTDPNNFFSVKIIYENSSAQITAASYSNLVMFLFVFFGFTIVLIRAVFFHSSHISPRLVAKLATNNLLNLITDSFEIYYKATVWVFMLWLAFFTLLVNVLIGRAYAWTGGLAFMTSLLATIILLRDVSKEIHLARQNINKINT